MNDLVLNADYVKFVVSHQTDNQAAMDEIAAELGAFPAAFILIFFPEDMRRDGISEAIASAFGEQNVFGFSTAGQITPNGYEKQAFLAIAFSKAQFRFASQIFKPLDPFSIKGVSEKYDALCGQFEYCNGSNSLALLFTDGLSKQEDLLIATLQACQPDLPIFGGSVGDGERFESTCIYADGALYSNAALLLLIETRMEYEMIGFDHFVPTDEKVIVTDANPNARIVHELNGAPAAQEYADVIGCALEDLSPAIFAQHPMLLRNANKYYVRSIQEVNPDGSLSFLCAIETGLILTIGEGKEIINTMDKELQKVSRENWNPEFIIGFDCFLRRLEIEDRAREEAASEIWRKHHVVGFNTYGEQHHGMHVNQTFVGIAFFDQAGRGAP